MKCQVKSLSARRAWIEIRKELFLVVFKGSLSARRAWIEMVLARNWFTVSCVALRKESVDRNVSAFDVLAISAVALRKESVDRNGMEINGVSYDVWSLSARRAWIEI